MKKRAILSFFLMAILLAGCGDSPQKGAREWFKAVMEQDGNGILDRTCRDQRGYIQEWGMWSMAMSFLPQMLGVDIELAAEGDSSSLKFKTQEYNSDRTMAYVRVTGEVRVALLSFANAYEVDETWIMVKEDDVWRWCGVVQ